jgi:alpha-ketoglutaric semialdehyde dehydrogenase
MQLKGLSILGYNRAKPSGTSRRAINPATGLPLEPGFFSASSKDLNEAVELAADAFLAYSEWKPSQRAEFLRRIAQGIEACAPTIIERANQETALPEARLQGEIGRTCGQLRLFATLVEAGWWVDARIDQADPNRKPVPKPDVRSMLVPLGPVVVFSSSNFPFAFSVAGGDTASALAAGCPVIVKAHQGHLGTSELVGMCIHEAARDCAAPEGVFSLLYGPGREVGIALVKHPTVAAVGFTGSRTGGRALMDAAAARPKPIPVYAEMGSINPVFFLPGALEKNAESLAAGLHASVTLAVGQFCTNPGLVFVPAGATAQTFCKKLEELMAATPPGFMLTADICAEYRAGIQKFTDRPAVRNLLPTSSQSGQAGAPALFVTDAATFLKDATLMNEVFGPSTLVVQCNSSTQMMDAARVLEGQLTATLHGTPEELIANRELVALLQTKAGRLVCNGFPTGVEVCHGMMHGGPYPATADGRSTSVGTRAITRFARPVCYQNFADLLLPDELKEANPLRIWRLKNGELTRE